MSDSSGRVTAYKFGEDSHEDLAGLAAAMAENIELAKEHLERGYIQKWIEEDLREYDARISLDKLLEENVLDLALFEFALRHAPGWTPKIEGYPVDETWLDEYLPQLLKDDYVAYTSELNRFAGKLYNWGALTDNRVTGGNTRMAAIDAAWRREYDDAARARGEMLLYDSLYRVPGSALEGDLFEDRHIELVLAKAYREEPDLDQGHYENAKSILAVKEKLALLVELWAAENPSAPLQTAYKVEDSMYFEAAKQRRWFVDMLERDAERTAGREAALRTAAQIAAHQHSDALSAREAAAEAENASKGIFGQIADSVVGLDPKIRAALFAVPVFVTTYFYDRWSGGFEWVILTGLALVLTIGAGIMSAMPVPRDKRWLDVVGSAAIGWGVFAYSAMDLHYSSFAYEAGFAALAGGLGFLLEPLLGLRRKLLARKEAGRARAVDPNNTERIGIGELEQIFFPETILDIPFSQRTPDQKAFAAAVQSGHADTTGLARFADPRSPVAPNHGAGFSANFGGTNIASDGTTTMEVMDGVSMDTDGNWNMRVVDGVTVHSDGKHTVSMGGFDVRSDGQISTEVGGFRISSGGEKKEEKSNWFAPKEETDWFGNKKKKGWFD